MNGEPHGLCHISVVIDHLLANIDILLRKYENKD
jgi:hypothetical protein